MKRNQLLTFYTTIHQYVLNARKRTFIKTFNYE